MPGVLRATSSFEGDVERLLDPTSYQHGSARTARSLLAARRPVIGTITSKPLALGFIAKTGSGAKTFAGRVVRLAPGAKSRWLWRRKTAT